MISPCLRPRFIVPNKMFLRKIPPKPGLKYWRPTLKSLGPNGQGLARTDSASAGACAACCPECHQSLCHIFASRVTSYEAELCHRLCLLFHVIRLLLLVVVVVVVVVVVAVVTTTSSSSSCSHSRGVVGGIGGGGGGEGRRRRSSSNCLVGIIISISTTLTMQQQQ